MVGFLTCRRVATMLQRREDAVGRGAAVRDVEAVAEEAVGVAPFGLYSFGRTVLIVYWRRLR